MKQRALAVLAAAFLSACGGGGGDNGGGASNPLPGGPSVPAGTNSLAGLVFYDQNGNGTLEADEKVRLPGVRVAAAGQTATSDAAGQFSLGGLAGGSQAVTAQTDSLPPYYQPGAPVSATLPAAAGTVVAVPVTLAIGGNRPNKYLAFGDSITEGTGSAARRGWTTPLEERLRAHFGEAEVIVDGVRGSRSVDGIERLPASLSASRPAYILVLYGTNDWNRCQSTPTEPCFTIAALRDTIRNARAAGTQAVVGTIIPTNPAYTDRMPVERNRWVALQNDLIRTMVQQEGAVLAETAAGFGTDPTLWPPLFFDQLHPVEAGYARITDAFFQAITRSRGTR
ncbi:MAG: GDSL-type esterase/lipase family protein [Vicinamibacteria bacterium]